MVTATGQVGVESVLVVDDDAMMRRLLSDLVGELGFRALAAASADEARALLVERPRLVLLDFHMPGISGDAFCQELRVRDDTWSLPIVMVTGANDEASIRRCLVAGADDFIVKPVERHELQAKLNAVRGGGELGFQRKLTQKRALLGTRNPYFVRNVARVLTNSGCEVAVASDLAAATRALSGKQRPDVAVLDVDALSADGVETLRHLPLADGGTLAPIVIASSETMEKRGADWASPRLWSTLAPFDAELERDDVLRHLSRALTVGGARGVVRRKVRVPFFAAVRFRWEDTPEWFNGIGFDLSESGVFVRTLAPLRPARRHAALQFSIGAKPQLSVKASVVWANGYGPRHVVTLPFGMGLSFTDIPEAAAQQIRDYVSQRLDAPRAQ